MLRRSPTVISLTENDLQFHLERIFARSNPPNIDELSLEDADQRSSEDQQPSTDKSAERLDNHRRFRGSNVGSSCMTRSSSMAAQTHSTGLPASMVNGSTHRTIVDPNQVVTAATTAAQLISSNLPQARASRLRVPSPSHPRTELTIPPQEFLDRHILPSPDGKKENRRQRSKDESRLSISQSSRLSPIAFPDLDVNLVPQRDLALVSTLSEGAGLTDTEASHTATDTN